MELGLSGFSPNSTGDQEGVAWVELDGTVIIGILSNSTGDLENVAWVELARNSSHTHIKGIYMYLLKGCWTDMLGGGELCILY